MGQRWGAPGCWQRTARSRAGSPPCGGGKAGRPTRWLLQMLGPTPERRPGLEVQQGGGAKAPVAGCTKHPCSRRPPEKKSLQCQLAQQALHRNMSRLARLACSRRVLGRRRRPWSSSCARHTSCRRCWGRIALQPRRRGRAASVGRRRLRACQEQRRQLCCPPPAQLNTFIGVARPTHWESAGAPWRRSGLACGGEG